MNTQQLWQAILGEMELLVSKPNFTTWFKQTYILSYKNGLITIAVPNEFTKNWFEKKYRSLIYKALQNITEDPLVKIDYKIVSANNASSSAKNQKTQTNKNILFKTGFNSNYTFNNFIVGKGNELAHAASMAVAKNPGKTYNPLFIYGGVGLGKTHLIQAIGNKILEKNPNKKTLFISCEKFINDFIKSLSHNSSDNFLKKYRAVDVLLVDDIQFLGGKEQTQEAFFHTFNELHQHEKQVVLTSDRPPKSIATLKDRLVSRFEWGMIADISIPDLETRSAILQYKAQEKNFNIDEEIINFLAMNIRNNIRELEGALNKLIAFHQINNIDPTIESTQQLLINLKRMPNKSSITAKSLITIIIEYYNISLKDILGACRKKNLVTPRQIAMYLMREEMGSSYPVIGQEVGGRDHTTAIHACDKIEKQLDADEILKQDIEIIRQKLYNN
ncbi:MAG: chromosomal replication initiator protein DnaA [Patescibacteria group bacterium]|nr:chromosomal replication initiator protein DnaA [Patescibacteria group bacterium]